MTIRRSRASLLISSTIGIVADSEEIFDGGIAPFIAGAVTDVEALISGPAHALRTMAIMAWPTKEGLIYR
jgi:hypothetical protein